MAPVIVKTDMKAYYARRADGYEEIYAAPEREDDLEELQERVQDVLAGHSVLELACGTGYWTEQYAELAEAVLATDNNPAMLAHAQARDLPDTVEFAEMDAFNVHTDRAFTACFGAFWWAHVMRQDQISYLEKLRAVLGKDAVLVLIDNNYIEGSSTPFARTDLEGNTFQIRELASGERFEILKNYPTDSALRKKFGVMAREIKIVRNEFYWMLTCRLK
jgi:ubiquinone/menaquinone biosynthesis C-methylase UbiE